MGIERSETVAVIENNVAAIAESTVFDIVNATTSKSQDWVADVGVKIEGMVPRMELLADETKVGYGIGVLSGLGVDLGGVGVGDKNVVLGDFERRLEVFLTRNGGDGRNGHHGHGEVSADDGFDPVGFKQLAKLSTDPVRFVWSGEFFGVSEIKSIDLDVEGEVVDQVNDSFYHMTA